MFRQKVKLSSLFTDELFIAKVVKFQRKIRRYTPETHPITRPCGIYMDSLGLGLSMEIIYFFVKFHVVRIGWQAQR